MANFSPRRMCKLMLKEKGISEDDLGRNPSEMMFNEDSTKFVCSYLMYNNNNNEEEEGVSIEKEDDLKKVPEDDDHDDDIGISDENKNYKKKKRKKKKKKMNKDLSVEESTTADQTSISINSEDVKKYNEARKSDKEEQDEQKFAG